MSICLKMGGKFLCLLHSKSILLKPRVVMHIPLIFQKELHWSICEGPIYCHGKIVFTHGISCKLKRKLCIHLIHVRSHTYTMIHVIKKYGPLDENYGLLDHKFGPLDQNYCVLHSTLEISPYKYNCNCKIHIDCGAYANVDKSKRLVRTIKLVHLEKLSKTTCL